MKKYHVMTVLAALLIACLILLSGCATKGTTTAVSSVTLPEVESTVASINKYGNLTLAMSPQEMEKLGYEGGDIVSVSIGSYSYQCPVGTSYSDVDQGQPLVRLNDRENELILAINMGSLAKTSSAKVGDTVTITLTNKGGYLDQYMVRQLKKSEERKDYASDEIFANFRAVKVGNIAENRLYRSCSPILDDARAPYAESLIKKASIKTVLNLADSKESATQQLANSPYYASLVEKGNVVFLDMGVSYTDPDFIAKLKDGLLFMTIHSGPYLVHCNEGKDRAGFVNALLEGLCGATVEEIEDDYMLSYANYYGVQKGTEQYNMIKKIVTDMLSTINAGKAVKDGKIDKVVTNYLIKTVGLTKSQVNTLKANLE